MLLLFLFPILYFWFLFWCCRFLYKVCLEAARYSTTSHIVMLFLAGHTRETENVLSFQYTDFLICRWWNAIFPLLPKRKTATCAIITVSDGRSLEPFPFFKKKLIRRTGILCVVWHPVGDGYFLKVKKGKEVCYLLLVYSEIRGVYLI